MASAFAIRPVLPSDWDAIRRLHAGVARVYRSPQTWDWLYGGANGGTTESVTVVAVAADGEVVAFVGGRYRKCWLKGQRQLALVVHDRVARSMGSSDGAHADISVLIACGEALTSLSLAPVQAFLTSDSLCASGPLAGGDSVTMLWRECVLSPLDELPGCTCLVRPTDFAQAGWNHLSGPRTGIEAPGFIADQAYLAWRYTCCPGDTGAVASPYWRFAFWSVTSADPLGCVVLRPVGEGVAILVEAQWPGHMHVLRDGMRQIAEFLTARGIRRIRTAISPASPGVACLDSLGFVPLQVAPERQMYALLQDVGGTSAPQWGFTLGDSLLY